MNVCTRAVRPKLIAFDFDGTLADSMACFLAALNAAAELHDFNPVNAELAEELRLLSSRQIMRRLGISLWKAPRVTMEVRRQMQHRVEQMRLFPGVEDTIVRLSGAGVQLAIATSNSQANVEAVVGPFLGRHIHSYHCGISVFGKRRALLALARQHGVSRDQLLYVGDEVRDAQAAIGCGVAFRGVSWGYAHPDILSRHCSAPLLRTPDELLHLLS